MESTIESLQEAASALAEHIDSLPEAEQEELEKYYDAIVKLTASLKQKAQ